MSYSRLRPNDDYFDVSNYLWKQLTLLALLALLALLTFILLFFHSTIMNKRLIPRRWWLIRKVQSRPMSKTSAMMILYRLCKIATSRSYCFCCITRNTARCLVNFQCRRPSRSFGTVELTFEATTEVSCKTHCSKMNSSIWSFLKVLIIDVIISCKVSTHCRPVQDHFEMDLDQIQLFEKDLDQDPFQITY